MSSNRWIRAKRLLSALLDADPEDPRDWLQQHANDPTVRSEVWSLFVARTEGFLEESALSDWVDDISVETVAPSTSVDVPESGMTIGNYRLLTEVGLGGMSVVYRAERVGADFEQTVAVKLLQQRLHADDVHQRFRAERQLLARLDHPHIAALVDGGVTDGGRPYLVMEYVDGTPITAYADENEFDLQERLNLLSQVLDAVQSAHRQLVVHRDLKPSNVLVTEVDGRPHAKLLDFGIAKLLDDSVPVTRPRTRTGRTLLTPSYAAPEQLTGGDVTTATDVYQFGVLAYELLAGRRPFDLDGKSPTQIETLITETDVPHPSDRSRSPFVSPRALRGDLDRILLKALRKEPERRYRSVEAVKADLERYRTGQPIEARPATLGYRATKFVRRNRMEVAAAATLVMLVAAFIGVLLWQQRQTAQQRDRARREAQAAEQVSTYLTSLFEKADPHLTQGDTVTARELLRQGINRIDELEDQPLVQAELMYVLGRTRRRIGLYDSTRHLLERALHIRRQEHGRTHPSVAEVLRELALFERDADGHYAEAESLLTAGISINRQLTDPNREHIANGLMNLVYVQRKQGKLEEAERSVRKALSIQRDLHGEEHMSVAESLYNLAAILRDQERYAKAEQIQRKSLRLCRSLTDGPHPGTAANLNNLALVLDNQGEYAAAKNAYQEALAMKRDLYGTPHKEVATTLSNLAQVLLEQEKYERAEGYQRRALRMRRSLFGQTHPDIAVSFTILGDILENQNELAAADSAFRAARDILRTAGQEHGPTAVAVLKQHGRLLHDREQYADAVSAFEKALRLQRKIHGRGDPQVKELRSELALIYEEWGKLEKAGQYRTARNAEQ